MKTKTESYMIDLHLLADKIRTARRQKGLTQIELGRRAGISGSYVSWLEKVSRLPKEEQRRPEPIVIEGLAAALDLDPHVLLPLAGHASVNLTAYQPLLEKFTNFAAFIDQMNQLRAPEVINTANEMLGTCTKILRQLESLSGPAEQPPDDLPGDPSGTPLVHRNLTLRQSAPKQNNR